ncbi:uncharacterized protein SPAPADRAFT_60264 [Spathaspora passalidarum NRRL Y-27907]|uniref:Uncharacterized protein n=1 Tax=Spathaspora passalidarum (strain NRRL Y-27907 / 11-Y1) TaxID=619300 RepID=G3AKG3_SPAPN|nr:uncharacterized protein SPAPADRAFT_60264 [Spathaspora passalidarum NRRL Y-27907]EGW32920.1 hypothetical protein SPAPADRAFT_60264 [Spathaspora passalidarum NRRL Y-27907]
MTDYYTPSLLFRQNAIRRYSPSLSPISSQTSLASTIESLHPNKNSWLLNLDNPKDSQVLTQSCSLNRVNIKSNYWKIPDTNMNLTGLAIAPNSPSVTPTLAISSGNRDANLFIYQLNLDENNLTHHCTITLPNIHAMEWVNNQYMITGNNKGYAHLVSIPSVTDAEENDEDAEICKRFNHRKHLKNHPDKYKSTAISKLAIHNNELISLYNNHLFQWDIKGVDTQTKPSPISITNISGISDMDTLAGSSTLAIAGKFGVSLFDSRDAKFKVPQYILPDSYEQFRELNANIIRWNSMDSNVLASGHGDGVVRLWDVRKINSCVASLCSSTSAEHTPTITTLEWNNGDIFTGAQDGNIIHWDLTSTPLSTSHTTCTLSEGLNSVKFDGRSNKIEIAQQRQCGTILPASNTNIVSMTSLQLDDDTVVVSIDGSSFLGVHSKVTEIKQYHTNLFDNTLVSSDTLVSVNEATQPLQIKEKRVTSSEPIIPVGINNVSVDTLQDVIVVEDGEDFHFGSNTDVDSCASLQVDSPNSSTHSVESLSTLATEVDQYNNKGINLMFNGIFDALS